jgi:NAD(P)-dependent dehydrogenase (short-subunit alcohol dehydrogenase family)
MTYYGSQMVVEHYNIMGVAKEALESAVRYIAAELGPKGIRVHATAAGGWPWHDDPLVVQMRREQLADWLLARDFELIEILGCCDCRCERARSRAKLTDRRHLALWSGQVYIRQPVCRRDLSCEQPLLAPK